MLDLLAKIFRERIPYNLEGGVGPKGAHKGCIHNEKLFWIFGGHRLLGKRGPRAVAHNAIAYGKRKKNMRTRFLQFLTKRTSRRDKYAMLSNIF